MGKQLEVFKNAYKTDDISDATDPAIRNFFADLNDPNLDPDKYQIQPDENGDLRYVDSATGGEEVNFSLEDIANGNNSFQPIAKADMPTLVTSLTKGLSQAVREEKRDWGVVEVTDWSSMSDTIDSRIDTMFKE